jgi:hypothetical protein
MVVLSRVSSAGCINKTAYLVYYDLLVSCYSFVAVKSILYNTKGGTVISGRAALIESRRVE